jgi:predicted nucleic acid-binding protein
MIMSDAPRTICVDASVGAKWFLPDEPGASAALRLLDMHVAGQLQIVVPELFHLEMANLLSLASRRGRVPAATALQAIDQLEHLDIVPAQPPQQVTTAALVLSIRLGISAYDAAYVATAEAGGCSLVTCDSRLRAAAAQAIPWVGAPEDVP